MMTIAISAPGLYRGRIAVDAGICEEEALLRRARGGDRAAFDVLVRRHAPGLYAVVVRLCESPQDAEEVTQEAFLRAWRGLPGFQGEARFFTWLYRIGVNEARRRSARARPALPVVSLDAYSGAEVVDRREQPHARAERVELRRALERAIGALTVEHRVALVLRDVEGFSTAQAADIAGLGEAAFKSRLHRARAALREAMANHRPPGAAA